MNEANVLLTGVPRSGTTLACQLLNKLPDTVALHEPMQGRDIVGHQDHRERQQKIEQFFARQRQSIAASRRAISRTVAGGVPDNPFGSERSPAGLRQHVDMRGELVVDKELSPNFTLVIKHTSAFAATLDGLIDAFPVYALIRNPLAVLASWSTVDAPAQLGHSALAEKFDVDLRSTLARLDDAVARQIHLLGWFYERFRRYLPEQSVIRYELLVESRGRALSVLRPEAQQLKEPLVSQNLSALYDRDHMIRLGERLLMSDGAYWDWYPKRSVEELLNEVQGASPGTTRT